MERLKVKNKMKNKNIYIANIIKSAIFVLTLILIFFHNTGITKIMIIPFITCGTFSIGKNFCFLINKNNFANLFSKLFVISFLTFWFGFLTLWSYLVIKESNYFTLIFTIPFWIAGIYIIRKFLFEKGEKSTPKQKESKLDFKIIISSFLVLSVLAIGIFCLFFGIRDTYKLNQKTKGYLTTEGYFKDYSIYNTDKGKITYKLIYTYKVGGKEYMITTDYGIESNSLPEINGKREIKYNPNNPSEAILSGPNRSNFLIYFGAFFTLGGSVFVLGALSIKGVFDKFKIDVMGTYIGIVFIIVGIGVILFQNGTVSSLFGTIKSLGIWILIPLLLIIAGTWLTVKSLFLKNKR